MAGCSGKGCQPGVPFWGICALVCFALAVLWLLLGIWATHLDERFTPVYTPIVCRMGQPIVAGVRGGLLQGLHLGLQINTTCENPNAYSLTLESPEPASVYLGAGRAKVATVTDIPRTRLPSRGNGTVLANANIDLSAAALVPMLSLLAAAQIPIYMEQHLHLDVDVNFLFGRWRTQRLFSKECGFNMEGLGGTLGRLIKNQYEGSLGPMACADSFDALTLPSVGEHGSRELRMFAVNVAPEEIEEAEQLKTIALSVAQGLLYALSGLLFVATAICLWLLWQRRAAEKSPVAAEGARPDEGLRSADGAAATVAL